MRDHSQHIELPRATAVATMLEHCSFAPGSEEVPVADAFGRTLASDVRALVTLPNCLTCSMDSVALHWDDFANLEPGAVPNTSSWTRGVEWQFANTGVGMPEGFDTAIAIENAEVSTDNQQLVRILAAPSKQYAGTQAAGSRMHEGDLVAPAGTVVTPAVAAAIAGAGHTSVPVITKPRVAFIPTGNELVNPGTAVPRGKNIESNSLVIRGKVAAWDGVCTVWPIVPDDPRAIEATLREACATCDIVVLNAGSSKGSDDWAMELLEEMGTVLNHETDHGPGHHSSYAVVDGTPIVGISGPALGAAFTTDFYLKPLIERWYGRSPEPVRVRARLAAPFSAGGPGVKKPAGSKPGGEDRPAFERTTPFYGIQFLTLTQGSDGVLEATPLPGRPSLTVFDTCDAYYPLDRSHMPQVGDLIEVELRG